MLLLTKPLDIIGMRIFVLYCLFFFPLSYVIAKNGYVEQNSAKYHSLTEKDTLYIETEKQNLKFYIGYVLTSKVKRMLFLN